MVNSKMAGIWDLQPPDLAKEAKKGKAAFTRKCNALERQIETNKECLQSKVFNDETREALKVAREAYEHLAEVYDALEDKLATEVFNQQYLTKRQEVEGKLDGLVKDASGCFSAYEKHSLQTAEKLMNSTGIGEEDDIPILHRSRKGKYKIESSMAPSPKLCLDFSLEDFQMWTAQWQVYYDVSQLEHAPETVQMGAFLQNLSNDLRSKLDIGHITDVKDALKAVREDYVKRCPLPTRRNKLFKAKQGKNENFSDFLTKLKMYEKDASLNEITAEEVFCHIMLAGCRDMDLLEKLLECEPITEASLRKVVEKYESIKNTKSGLFGKNKGEEEKVRQINERTICYRCQGKGKHFARDCPVPASALKCEYCGKSGLHNSNVKCKEKMDELKGKKNTGDGDAEKKKHKKNKKSKTAKRVLDSDSPAGGSDSEEEKEEVAKRVTAVDSCADTDDSDEVEEHVVSKIDVEDEEEIDNEEEMEEFACSAKDKHSGTPTVEVKISPKAATNKRQGKNLKSVPDTGASISCMKLKVAKMLGIPYKPSKVRLKNASGKRMEVVGEALVFMSVRNGPVRRVRIIITPHLTDDLLISWSDQKKLSILPISWPEVMPSEERCRGVVRTEVADAEWPAAWSNKMKGLLNKFDDRFKDNLEEDSRLVGGELHLKLKPDATPFQTTRVQKLNYHEKAQTDKELEKILKAGLLRPLNEPTDHLYPAMWLRKPGREDAWRLVADLTELNKRCVKDVYHFPSPEDLWKKVKPGSKLFLSIDACSSYHQVKLSEESKKLVRVSLPQGIFEYQVAAQGHMNSGSSWNRFSDKALEAAIKNGDCSKGVDDLLIEGETEEEILQKLERVLEQARKSNLTFSRKKVMFGSEVDFCGYRITPEGCFPLPSKLKAIREFEAPSCETELRQYLGMCQSMAHFMPDLSQATLPLRALLKKKNEFRWGPNEAKVFQQLKDIMVDNMSRVAFDETKPLKYIGDASSYGLGYVLLQWHEEEECRCEDKSKICGCRWRLLWANSTTLKPSYRHLSSIYLEMISIHWGVRDAQYFIKGCVNPVTVVTDHYALVGISHKDIHDIPEKLRDMFMDLQHFQLNFVFLAGRRNQIADALSRRPLFSDPLDNNDHQTEVMDFVCRRLQKEEDLLGKDPMLEEIIMEIEKSDEYRELTVLLKQGRRKEWIKKNMPSQHCSRGYLAYWDGLGLKEYEEDKFLITYEGDRLLIPRGEAGDGKQIGWLRKEITRRLHIPHQGVVKTKKAASLRYFWLGISEQVSAPCRSCATCIEHEKSHATEPPVEKADLAFYPMDIFSVDMFKWEGKDYLMGVDWFSCMPFMKCLGKTSSTEAVIKRLKKWALTYGVPRRIRADFGPHFRQRFQRWCERLGIKPETSSAYLSQSNSRVERVIGEIKKLMTKCKEAGEDFDVAFSEWKMAPRVEGPSPSQVFFRRKLRSSVLPEIHGEVDEVKDMMDRREEEMKNRAKRMTRFPAPVLEKNQKVWLQEKDSKRWCIKGRVRECRPHGKSYIVETESGSLFLRNRKWLKPRGEEKKKVQDKKKAKEKEEEEEKQEDEEKQEEEEKQEDEEKQEVKKKRRSYAEVVAGKSDKSANVRNARKSVLVASSDRRLRASTTANTKDSLDRRDARH